jgi:hypothetical protein
MMRVYGPSTSQTDYPIQFYSTGSRCNRIHIEEYDFRKTTKMRITVGFTALTALASLMIPSNVSGQRLIGPLQVSDVEITFGLEAGSVFIEGDIEVPTLKEQNLWTQFKIFTLP